MTKYCLLSATALGLFGSLLGRADIVVNFGPPPNCPPCEVNSQPDLSNLASQQFTLSSPIEITSINFWTYEVPNVASYPVFWSITDASNNTIGSGTDPNPTRGTPLLVPNLGNTGFDLQVSMITLDLGGPLDITPNPSPETFSLNLKFTVPSNQPAESQFYWAQGTEQHLAFQLEGANNAIVPEPAYLSLVAGGLGVLMALRIRRKR